MVDLWNAKKKKRLKRWLSSYPVVGLLDVAVQSIKYGMWDSMYDTFQILRQEIQPNIAADKKPEFICIEVDSDENNAPVPAEKTCEHERGFSSDDIIKHISSYFCADESFMDNANLTKEMKISFLRKLHSCESWLIETLRIKDFECLGYGDFFMFLERYLHLLPSGLKKYLIHEAPENSSLEVCMLPLQLDVFLSQVSSGICQNEKINKKLVLELLEMQYPSVCLKSLETDSFLDFQDRLRAYEGKIYSDIVLFSATLFSKSSAGGSNDICESFMSDLAGLEVVVDHSAGVLGPVTSKDAIEVFLRAPMLTDLYHWAHWDLIFAPSLGPLLEWLLNEVNAKELLCLVTKGGTIVRLDHLATVESFFEALLRGSAFRTAVKLLSLLAIYGGQKNLPLSLLKSHAQKALKIFIDQSMEKKRFCALDSRNVVPMPSEDALESCNLKSSSDNLCQSGVNEADHISSRFFLDCLNHLPSEFCTFAASVLLSGLQAVIKDAPSAILRECKKAEERVMLHQVGFSLGILEWISDYRVFSSSSLIDTVSCSEGADFELDRGAEVIPCELVNVLPAGVSVRTPMKTDQNEYQKEENPSQEIVEVSAYGSSEDLEPKLCQPGLINNPIEVIEAIRRDEFGLDSTLSPAENKLLMKQHTRLGRALHCLSQELYSQDSHFLLELVQNADDNLYPRNVEPSLMFILQEKGIIVLNNEIGFSAENIRALCDVGSSTKKDLNAGYIGKKGIGFKSVFRVTDAPEIHSNGFHIKFDITEGQIGFVLPTVVPPCDIDLYSIADSDKSGVDDWKTCIVLPFKGKSCEGFAMNNIVSMFSDLHPSLLLFLHRLQCIKLRNMIDNTTIVMRKEVLADGIVRVSFGKEKMAWLVVSKILQASAIRPDAKETEISLAFTLEETGEGSYAPLLKQQPVFAFLPLRTYGLKFILQGDFVLPSSREEVDGNSPWNQWILAEFPEVFVNAQQSFSNLPCFRENPARAVTVFLSFVPLVGEVHGFFSSLPRMIISKLRMSKCLLLEADNMEWVLPCKTIRNWDERARALFPDRFLVEHLGMGFLRKDIVLSDPLARALGVEEYGPKTLLNVMSSLSRSENCLRGMGFGWLATWINEIYLLTLNWDNESDLIAKLRKIPFIPLSDGKFCSVERCTIWLHISEKGVEDEYSLDIFSKLYAKLQTVNPALFSAIPVFDKVFLGTSIAENISRMLMRVGVQRLSAHEIVKMHILPAISGDIGTQENKDLLTEYLAFLMLHLQSSCPDCCKERGWIMEQLRSKSQILTNYGYKRLNNVPIHFSVEYGNPVDISRLISDTSILWHEIDSIYLQHPITKLIPDARLKWRNFFQELGVTDFVKVVQVEKCIEDVSDSVMKNMMLDGESSIRTIVKDWDSGELGTLLSELISGGDRKRCKYLLEVLDTLWDDCFSDKVFGCYATDSCELGKPFRSSFITTLGNVKWMASSMDDKLHYPKDLFHDCEPVRSILGVTAPYATPKVRSQKLLEVLGVKSRVRLDDVLSILEVWRRTEKPFKASISQMSKFYTFIWNEMATSKARILDEISSRAFIFIPHIPSSSPENIETGSFLSTKEVFWHDTTGSMDQMKLLDAKCALKMTHLFSGRILQSFYPTLHDFFVCECGVEELPSVDGYLQILIHLSKIALPSQVAKTVFNVFSKWADQLKSGSLNDEAIEFLRERFNEKDCTVLPTVQDKWVSLHPSFGLVCWSDDYELRREFKNVDGVDLLYFTDLFNEEKQFVHSDVATLMRRLGVPALSSVVIRQAIYYGPTDASFKTSVVNWALPYAQRYIFHLHPDKYLQLKQSGLESVRGIRIVVVEKLFYKNAIKTCGSASQKRFECSSLLQGNILYATQQSDCHSIFMELSRAFFDGVPELHLANFLHMITTMVEAGSSQEQTEFFVLNSQKVPKLPDGESVWSLSPQPVVEHHELETASCVATTIDEPNTLKKSKKMPGISSSWPPVDWKTAPGFGFASKFVSKSQVYDISQSSDGEDGEEFSVPNTADWGSTSGLEFSRANALLTEACDITEAEAVKQSKGPEDFLPLVNMHSNWSVQDAIVSVDQTGFANDLVADSLNAAYDSVDPVAAPGGLNLSFSDSRVGNPTLGGAVSAQAQLTGRMGEFAAYKYFQGKAGETSVKWVNEVTETGLPYDILIGQEEQMEYIEVKATRSKSATRDLAFISAREWQFGCEKGESFSIAHVIFLDDSSVRITVYKNPVKLCQLGKLRLAIIMPKPAQLSNRT
ncbi:OLC1v1019113C2 [Oldenlandia corymbosa var. corymbosa]|nr:OLC1v1019113C2 [Oldenlandia corymbosa var. corymbosa]